MLFFDLRRAHRASSPHTIVWERHRAEFGKQKSQPNLHQNAKRGLRGAAHFARGDFTLPRRLHAVLSTLTESLFVETVHRVQDGSYRLTDGWDSERRLDRANAFAVCWRAGVIVLGFPVEHGAGQVDGRPKRVM
jgi:hypothetical protein